MPMNPPKCQHCHKAHWPKEGCSLTYRGCSECLLKDIEIKALREQVESLDTDEIQSLARQALNRREYHKKYMRKKRANA